MQSVLIGSATFAERPIMALIKSFSYSLAKQANLAKEAAIPEWRKLLQDCG